MRQIEELYHLAKGLTAEQRKELLARSDPELRREVESLIAQENGDNPLDQPPMELAANLLKDSSIAGLTVGEQLGSYKIEGLLGAGGMGQVYKARDTRLGRTVAIKVLSKQFSGRFEREARAISSLNHPNICTLHDVGPNYLVMELVEGATLADRIKPGALPLKEALGIARQIADALEAAHERGVVHRDLKPGNIKIKPDGTVKVLDFGLATHSSEREGEESTATVTAPGTILGTAAYMSPEQARGTAVDKRADVWAFGAVVYEMLTGQRAFQGERVTDVLAAVVNNEPDWNRAPEKVQRLLRRCLEKDPKKRLRDIGDVELLLEDAPREGLESRTPLRSRLGVVASISAVLLVGAVAGWTVLHSRRPPVEERSLRLQIAAPEGGRFAFGNVVGGVALSPDGMSAAFVTSGSDKNGLWVQRLDGTPARLLPGTEDALDPFWSPDNKSIAFHTGAKLKRVDLAGGLPLEICDAPLSCGGVWLKDGQILFGTFGSGLFKVASSGGTPSHLTALDASLGDYAHVWPQVLPGGRFLYLVASLKPENVGVYAASFAKPTERVRLLTTDSNALYAPGNDGKSYLLWLRGATLFAQEFNTNTLKLAGEPYRVADPVSSIPLGRMNAAVSATGLLLYSDSTTSTQFTWIDRAGKSLGVVGDPGYYDTFRLSPDGRRAAMGRDLAGTSDLWLLDLERGASSRFPGVTSGRGSKFFPIWSPDGRAVVFRYNGARALVRKDSSGAGTEQRVLTTSAGGPFPTDWSRDGRFVLYQQGDGRGNLGGLWILPVTPDGSRVPGTEPRPYLRTQFRETYGRFSPENSPRWVAYESDETGRLEIYIQAFPEPHGATRISTNGGQYPQWSPDGRELFYVSPDYKLMVVSLKLGAGSVQPSAPRELLKLPAFNLRWEPYEVAPDGQRFLVRAISQQPSRPLTVIVNWLALLKKAAP